MFAQMPSRHADKHMLQLAIRNLVGISDADRVSGTNPLWMAFAEMGIRSFLGDLITLTEHDIMDLQIRRTHTEPHPNPIPILRKRRTVIIIAAYHHYS